MSELTVHSVCTKGPIYPTLLYFQNGRPTKDFETNCAVLQDKNKSRTIVMEASELVYAGNEEKEDTGKILILARDRISGNVRLLEVGSADLKPLTKTDLDYLEHQHEVQAKHSKMVSKKTKALNKSNAAQRDTGQTDNLVACNNSIGVVDIPPIDREITRGELDCLQQQHEISSLEFLEFERKKLEQREKLKINVKTAMEPEQTEMRATKQKNLTALGENEDVIRGATKVRGVYRKKKISSKKQLKLPLVPKPHARLKKPRRNITKKDFMRRKDYYEIDPDEFYVPFLNREATNLEDVYVIKEIFSEDEYFQIYSELAEIIYLDDLHPYIQQSVDNKTLSIEFTVLAVYASVLLKFLHASLEEIRTGNSEICQHSKTLYEILLKRFTERVQYEKRTSITRSRVMRNKIVCHIIVCTLILNDFQFKMDSLSDVIERKNHEPLPTLVSFVAATIEKGDDGPMVKLKLPLVVKLKNLTALEENYCDEFHILPVNRGVTKVRGVCHKKKISSRYKLNLPLDPKPRARLKKPSVTKIKKDFVQRKDYYEIDPDEFYIPFLNREATKVEDVYVINQIFSDDEYSQIFFELAENNYLDDLHPYIKQFVENKTLSLEFTVLAVYASVLIKFLHASLDEIKKGNSKICQHSKTLYAIILKRFTEQVKYKTRSGLSRSRAMRNKIVCHIIVCTLILNDFQFEMDSLSDAIKGNYNKNYQEPLRKLVSYVAATIEIGDDETMVKLKLPLVPKIRASIPRKFAQKIILSKDEYVQSVQTSIINEDSEMAVQLKLPLVPKPQAPLRKPKLHKIDKKCEDHYEINEDELYCEIDPDEFYVPFLNREATNLEDVYVINQIFSEDEYSQIFLELGETNYMGDLHPYIHQFVENKTLSLEFTVLAVYASVLIKFLHASLDKIKKGNSKICQHSKTLYEILLNRFTQRVQYEKRTNITRSRAMRSKIVCHIIVCTLILNDFQFKMDSLSDVIERKPEPLPTLVRIVAATIEIRDDGTMVKLKLPIVPKTQATILRKYAQKIKRNLTKRKEETETDEIDPDDFYLPAVEDHTDKILSKDEYVQSVQTSIISEDSEMTMQLKLPLVTKPQAPLRKPMPHKIDKKFVQRESHYEIDPDEFYVQFLNREATNLEDVYVIDQIFSEDEYSQIFFELAENNYLDDLHPYIKQFVENKTLSLEFTVLAVYASVLIKFLHASLDKIKTGNSKICQHSKTLNEILLERFTERVQYEKQTSISRSRAMSSKTVCHIIVCTLILNNFQFKTDSLSDAIERRKCRNHEPLPKLVSFVAATIEKGDDGTMVKLKLPLVPKTRATILRKDAQKIERNLKKRKGGGGEEAETDKIDPDDFYLPTIDREATEVEDVYPVEEILPKDEYETIDEDEGSLVKLKLPLVPKTEDIINKTSKRHTVDKDLTEYNENMVDTDDIIDPDDFYVLPINRDATELENVYLIDKIFSKSKYEKIYCELEKSDYSEYLHPYIQSIVENQSLSLQLTVLAVYASELIKFIHVPSSQMKKPNFKICHHSETLNHLIRKRFTELAENKCGRNSKSTSTCIITSLAMKEKMVCHVIVCVLILNNFQCELDPLSDAVKHKKYITDVQEYICLVGASIVDGDNGKMVQLKLPLVSKTRITRRKRSTKIRKIKTATSSKRRKKR